MENLTKEIEIIKKGPGGSCMKNTIIEIKN